MKAILNGDPAHPDRLIAPQWSIWWYKLDDITEVNMPEMWIKANPNLGITVSYETYAQDVETADLRRHHRRTSEKLAYNNQLAYYSCEYKD